MAKNGYIATVVDPKANDRLLATFDYTFKNNPDYMERLPEFPLSPLAVVGKTVARLPGDVAARFYGEELIIYVTDPESGRVDGYNLDQFLHELDMEIMAG